MQKKLMKMVKKVVKLVSSLHKVAVKKVLGRKQRNQYSK